MLVFLHIVILFVRWLITEGYFFRNHTSFWYSETSKWALSSLVNRTADCFVFPNCHTRCQAVKCFKLTKPKHSLKVSGKFLDLLVQLLHFWEQAGYLNLDGPGIKPGTLLLPAPLCSPREHQLYLKSWVFDSFFFFNSLNLYVAWSSHLWKNNGSN